MFNLTSIVIFWRRVLQFFIALILLVFIINLIPEIIDFLQTRPESTVLVQKSLKIIINLIPPIFAMIFVALIGAHFAQAVYKLDNVGQGFNFLSRHIFGRPGFRPFLIFSDGKISLGADGVLPRTGGPGGLVIHNDTAIVLEKKGQLTRVEGPGFPALEPFEQVYDIIDLRPKRWVYNVGAMTKEGIPINWDVEVRYQIDDGEQEPAPEVPYPFSNEAVFKAATGKWRREMSRFQDMDWGGWVVISQTEGTLRSILARRHLDELIGLTEAQSQTARESVQEELEQAIQRAAPKVGAKILKIKLHNLKVEDEVTRQWIDFWQTQWQGWSTERLAATEVDRLKELEIARVEGQLEPLNDLTHELNVLDMDPAVLLSRLASVLDHSHTSLAASRVFYPAEALKTIDSVRDLLRKKDNGNGGNNDVSQLPPPPPRWRSTVLRRLPVIDVIAAGQEIAVTDDVIGYVDVLKRLPVIDDVETGTPGHVSDESHQDRYVQQTGTLEFEYEGQPLVVELLKGSKLAFSENFDYFAVQVSGDSMDQANIVSGDLVILQRPNRIPLKPDNRDIVAVVFRDEDNKATLKRMLIDRDKIIFIPESSNPKHRPRTVNPRAFVGDNPQVQVVGIVIAVLKNEYKLIQNFFKAAGFELEDK